MLQSVLSVRPAGVKGSDADRPVQRCEEGRQQEERGEERQPQAEDDIFLAPEQHVGGVRHPAQEVAGEPGRLEEEREPYSLRISFVISNRF